MQLTDNEEEPLVEEGEEREGIDTKRDLCPTCQYQFADCGAQNPKFGDGKGKDNVYECSMYVRAPLKGYTGPDPEAKPVPEANWVPPPPMTKTTVIFLQPEDWEWLVGRLRQQNKRISMLETVMVRLIGDSLDTMEKERSAGEVVEEQG